MQFRTAYTHGPEHSDLGVVDDFGPSLTVQDQREDADINTIVKRFGLTGQVPQLERLPLQDEFVNAMSFHEAQNALISARNTFMTIPATIRSKFDNDAGKFVEFCSDPKNLEELRSMGLAPPAPAPAPSLDTGGPAGATGAPKGA